MQNPVLTTLSFLSGTAVLAALGLTAVLYSDLHEFHNGALLELDEFKVCVTIFMGLLYKFSL